MAGNPLANMMMNNNPLFRMVNVLKTLQNPMQGLNQIAGQDQGMANVMQIANGKSPEQISEIVQNAITQKGINMNELAQMAQSIGIPPEVATRYGISMQKDQTNNA